MTPWLIVGLGNPGPQYALTRHNAGHLVIEALLERADEHLARHKTGNLVCEARIGRSAGGAPGPRAIVAITTSFMNVSGPPIARLAQFYRIAPERILVIHDELDLPAHQLRLKTGGGEGGHNGLKSLTSALGGRNYHRLRVGIGRPPGRMDPARYVLAQLPAREREELLVTCERAVDVIEDIVINGFTSAQQNLHSGEAH